MRCLLRSFVLWVIEECEVLCLRGASWRSFRIGTSSRMGKIRSYGIQGSSIRFSNHVTMCLLLSFVIYLPVALGSENVRRFQLEGELSVEDVTPPSYWNANPPPPLPPHPPYWNPVGSPPGIPNQPPPSPPPPPPPPPPSPVPLTIPPPAPLPSGTPGSAPPPVQVSNPPENRPDIEPPASPKPPSLAPDNEGPLSPPVIILPPRPPLASPASAPLWNESEKAGIVILALVVLLQVIVVTYLLVKRRQMLAMVEEDCDYDNPNSHYGIDSA